MIKDSKDFKAEENSNVDERFLSSQMETMNMILFLIMMEIFQMKA